MSNSDLLDRVQQLSRAEKFQLVYFLMAELAKEEGLVLEDEAADIIAAVHNSHGSEQQLMKFIEMKQEITQNA